MASVECKSGKHLWDSSQKEQIEKCCNGYTLMWEPWDNEETGGYDQWGNWFGASVLVKDDDHAEIARIKALQPMERKASKLEKGMLNKQ